MPPWATLGQGKQGSPSMEVTLEVNTLTFHRNGGEGSAQGKNRKNTVHALRTRIVAGICQLVGGAERPAELGED